MSDIDIAVVDSLKALDPKRPIREADIDRSDDHVSFGPDFASYSIISSARERSEGGTVRPSALAVFRLITIASTPSILDL